jgi:hypothetical protein
MAKCQGDAKKADDKKKDGKKKKDTSVKCHINLIRSYLLKGRLKSKQDNNVLCPTIKENCCTKLDQQRIYHLVNDIVPGRTIEYSSKMKMALAKLNKLHLKILTNKPVFTGNAKRRAFCGAAERKLLNFPFKSFYMKLINDLDGVRTEINEFYNTFFCNLCDGVNHTHMDLKKKRLTMDAEFCQNLFTNHQEVLQMVNVELIEYLETLQHVVDCTHYLKSYNLKFFDAKKQTGIKATTQCLNNLGSKDFLKFCKSTCANLQISKINVLFEGDFEFLIDAVNLFDKFFDYKESGNFISMKLRLFFKKFVIPRKLTQKKKQRFLKELRQREEKKAKRRLQQIKKKTERALKEKGKKVKSNRMLLDETVPNKERGLEQVKQDNVVNTPFDKEQVTDKEEEIQTTEDKTATVVPDDKVKLKDGRILQTKPAAPAAAKDAKTDPKKKGAKKKKHKKAKLIYNKELFHFYEEITIIPPDKKEYVYRIRPKPIDIDTFTKVFVMHDGINPGKYMGSTRFKVPMHLFYKMLFSYRKPDQPDPNLLFFLDDFTDKSLKEVKLDLKAKFSLRQKKKKGKKGKKKKMRILEQTTSLGRTETNFKDTMAIRDDGVDKDLKL